MVAVSRDGKWLINGKRFLLYFPHFPRIDGDAQTFSLCQIEPTTVSVQNISFLNIYWSIRTFISLQCCNLVEECAGSNQIVNLNLFAKEFSIFLCQQL